MSNFLPSVFNSDFSQQGYQTIEELGRNFEGGRITWKARAIETEEIVILKQFCFAIASSSWSGFEACDREIKILQRLDHPGIPKYLNSFQTDNGFCLIQEYKDASSLAIPRIYKLEEIKTIALKVLEILVYLQALIPPVIHQDIKPENILLDRELNVYLIDFGFASLGLQEASVSNVFKGTPGFIPPEQIVNPDRASDLYALGVTLICLLTGVKSTEVTKLAKEDSPYQLEFKTLLPQLNFKFVRWLEKTIEPSLKKRFSNAQLALEELKKIDLDSPTEINSDRGQLVINSQKIREKLTQSLLIGLTNSKIRSNLDRPPYRELIGVFTISILVLVSGRLIFSNPDFMVTPESISIAVVGAIVTIVAQISAGVIANSLVESVAIALAISGITILAANVVMGIIAAAVTIFAIVVAEAIVLVYLLIDKFKHTKNL
jgi:serine/threonine protein kinase